MAIVKRAYMLLSGLLFIVIISSVACTISSDPAIEASIASATLHLTETPTPVSVNEINTILTIPQPSPSGTPFPTVTSSPEPTLLPTVEPTETMDVFSTQLTGFIVYQSRRIDTNEDGIINIDDGIHLYLLNVESGETIQLTTGEYRDLHPNLSPDTRMISFISNRNNDLSQVFVMNINGTEVIQISETPGEKACPKWSPDGKQISYTVNNSEGEEDQNRIELFSLETGETEILVHLPNNQLDCPSWSPDGSHLVIGYKQGNKSHIAILDLQAGELIGLNLDNKRYDEPKFLPRFDGLFLSLIQSPGDFSSASLLIFQLNQDDLYKQPTLLFSIEDIFGGYTWANGGHLLIETDGFGPQKSSNDVRSGYEISMIPVDFSTLTTSEGGTPSIFAFELRTLLTENNFYDDYPDWAP
ncbi:TolB family protein [Candidatus Leptofilum sp.]|uniref:TolB family protein n=1 Tax=Candidatus Leptofilum sp. TaxID=3241576 RepID=UPI003B5C02E0